MKRLLFEMPRCPRRIVALCCCGMLIPTAHGCSFAMRAPPNDPVPPDDIQCDSSTGAATADLILGGSAIALAAVAVASAGGSSCPTQGWGSVGCIDMSGTAYLAGGISAVAGVVYLVSSGTGFKKAARCRALEEWKVAVALDPSLPWPPAEPVELPSQPRDRPMPCIYRSDCEGGEICFDGFCRPR